MYNDIICCSSTNRTDAMGCQSHTDNTRQRLHLPELNEIRIQVCLELNSYILEENNR